MIKYALCVLFLCKLFKPVNIFHLKECCQYWRYVVTIWTNLIYMLPCDSITTTQFAALNAF